MASNSPSRTNSCCFWCNSSRKPKRGAQIDRVNEKNKNEEMLSDFSTFSVKEQERRLKEAAKEEEKIIKEAERVVNWVKQESARIDVSTIDTILRETHEKLQTRTL